MLTFTLNILALLSLGPSKMHQVEQWRVYEITLTSTQVLENPFMDVGLTATFTNASGTTISRPGYWYKDRIWKVRFAPPEQGVWTWVTECSDPENTDLHGKQGELECIPYTGDRPVYRHGFLKSSADRRYLVHADGTPFFYLGDTHWFMELEDYDTIFQPMLHKRLEQKYTVYQSHPVSETLSHPGATMIDPEKYIQLDRYFQSIADSGMVHAFGLSAHNSIDYFTPEGSERLARYMCARYGAYPVIFFTSQEVDIDQNQDKWKHAFDAWNEADDYNHPATCHLWASYNSEPLFWADDPGHDLFFLQAGHGRLASIAHYQTYWDYDKPTKPFVEAESNYEEIILGNLPNHADMVRKAAYKSIQCGSLGFAYGANGIWNICWTDDRCACCEQWGINVWTEAIDFPGGQQMQYLHEFYLSLDWWKLIPRFTDGTWSAFKHPEESILKTNGRECFVAYFHHEDTATGILKNMDDQALYRAQWFDPRTGEYTTIAETIEPHDHQWAIPDKPDPEDWVLLVKRKPTP